MPSFWQVAASHSPTPALHLVPWLTTPGVLHLVPWLAGVVSALHVPPLHVPHISAFR